MSKLFHRVSPEDRDAMLAFRDLVAPNKGAVSGPHARELFNGVMEHVAPADGVRYEAGQVGGVNGVWCRNDDPQSSAAILHLHGGAYVLGSAWAYRHFAGQIAAHARAPVFVPDYRLAPEHPFPAALVDAQAAYRGLVEEGTKTIAIVGDSAGGGLALALLSVLLELSVRGTFPIPVAAAVFSPWTDLALSAPSLSERADADPLLTADGLSAMAKMYLDGVDARSPYASPLYGSPRGLPPLQMHVGTEEVLHDDATRFADKAGDANVAVHLHVWEGMPHVFLSNVATLKAARQALKLTGEFLNARLFGAPDTV